MITLAIVTLVLLLIAALASAEKSPPRGTLSDRIAQMPRASEKSTQLVTGRSPSGTRLRAESAPALYYKRLAAKRLKLLSAREHRIVRLLKRLRRDQAHSGAGQGGTSRTGHESSPRAVICSVFGAHCSEALRVSWCESRWNIYARNGQYLGLFQMGEYARARYGHGWDAWTQSRAAHRYFLDAGWSPWACKP